MSESKSGLSPLELELRQRSQRNFWPLRAAIFVLATLGVWSAYFWWRPPLPMLFLRHVELLPRSENAVALTFDDAPHPLTTPLLLASLQRADAKASFFCVGENLRLYPELGQRILRAGHLLENHSQPHHNLTTVAPSEFPLHIDAGFDQIQLAQRAAGIKRQTALFRPPGGGLNRAAMDYLWRKNYTLAWWSNNVGDWTCPPAWKIADGVKANLRADDVILLHDGGTGTPQAVPAIVRAARKAGLKIVLMPERASN